jgi:hypothetical protein
LTSLTYLVNETSASLEGKLLREDEGVVAIEQEGVDLGIVSVSANKIEIARATYLGHFGGLW